MKTFNVLRTHHIRPKKRLGQNFLVDNNIRDKMCNAMALTRGDSVLEIGAGFGILTEKLAEKASHIWAVECDKTLSHILHDELRDYQNTIDVITESILHVDIGKLAKKKKVKVIGNVPYYITTKILFYLVKYRTYIEYAVLTIQKELAERLLALPGKKAYGRLTVSMRFFATVQKLFEIKPNSFFPAPDVTSVVIKLDFQRTIPRDINEALFLDIVEALFQERRKNIQNALCLLKTLTVSKAEAKKILDACNIDIKKRGEQLMLKDFIALTRFISSY